METNRCSHAQWNLHGDQRWQGHGWGWVETTHPALGIDLDALHPGVRYRRRDEENKKLRAKIMKDVTEVTSIDWLPIIVGPNGAMLGLWAPQDT